MWQERKPEAGAAAGGEVIPARPPSLSTSQHPSSNPTPFSAFPTSWAIGQVPQDYANVGIAHQQGHPGGQFPQGAPPSSIFIPPSELLPHGLLSAQGSAAVPGSMPQQPATPATTLLKVLASRGLASALSGPDAMSPNGAAAESPGTSTGASTGTPLDSLILPSPSLLPGGVHSLPTPTSSSSHHQRPHDYGRGSPVGVSSSSKDSPSSGKSSGNVTATIGAAAGGGDAGPGDAGKASLQARGTPGNNRHRGDAAGQRGPSRYTDGGASGGGGGPGAHSHTGHSASGAYPTGHGGYGMVGPGYGMPPGTYMHGMPQPPGSPTVGYSVPYFMVPAGHPGPMMPHPGMHMHAGAGPAPGPGGGGGGGGGGAGGNGRDASAGSWRGSRSTGGGAGGPGAASGGPTSGSSSGAAAAGGGADGGGGPGAGGGNKGGGGHSAHLSHMQQQQQQAAYGGAQAIAYDGSGMYGMAHMAHHHHGGPIAMYGIMAPSGIVMPQVMPPVVGSPRSHMDHMSGGHPHGMAPMLVHHHHPAHAHAHAHGAPMGHPPPPAGPMGQPHHMAPYGHHHHHHQQQQHAHMGGPGAAMGPPGGHHGMPPAHGYAYGMPGGGGGGPPPYGHHGGGYGGGYGMYGGGGGYGGGPRGGRGGGGGMGGAYGALGGGKQPGGGGIPVKATSGGSGTGGGSVAGDGASSLADGSRGRTGARDRADRIRGADRERKSGNSRAPSAVATCAADLAALDGQLSDLAARLTPAPAEEEACAAALEAVRALVGGRWPHAHVHMFGSAANGLAVAGSNEIDVTIEEPEAGDDHAARGAMVAALGELAGGTVGSGRGGSSGGAGAGAAAAGSSGAEGPGDAQQGDAGAEAEAGASATEAAEAEPEAQAAAASPEAPVPEGSTEAAVAAATAPAAAAADAAAAAAEGGAGADGGAGTDAASAAAQAPPAAARGVSGGGGGSSGMEAVTALPKARTPVVRLTVSATKTRVDVTINNMLALANTRLLAAYARLDGRLRRLVLLVKHWARCRGVNDAYRGSLSSYAYVLLCVWLLQQRQPPILPVLQARQPPTYDTTVGAWRCAFNDCAEELAGFGADNKETLAELLVAFFDHWAWRHDYNGSVVCVRTGGTLAKTAKEWTKRQGNERHLMCIEDPFELSHDLGRTIDKAAVQVLRREFERAARILATHPDPLTELLAPLTPEEEAAVAAALQNRRKASRDKDKDKDKGRERDSAQRTGSGGDGGKEGDGGGAGAGGGAAAASAEGEAAAGGGGGGGDSDDDEEGSVASAEAEAAPSVAEAAGATVASAPAGAVAAVAEAQQQPEAEAGGAAAKAAEPPAAGAAPAAATTAEADNA